MINLQRNVSLKNYSNFKIGGNASYFLEVLNIKDLAKGLKKWQEISRNFSEDEKRIFVLGFGTNVLFPDEGLKGLVIKNSIDGILLNGNTVKVGAGTLVSKLLDFCIENNLSGLEW